MNTVEALFDNIMCYRIEHSSHGKAKRGISTKEKSLLVEVISIGDDVNNIKAGDKLLIKKFSGIEVDINNENVLFITKNDILAKIK